MDLFDLLQNPLVIGLVLWLVSKIFTGGKKEDESKQKKRPTSVPKQQKQPKPVFTTVEEPRKKRETRRLVQKIDEEAFERTEVLNENRRTVSRLNQPTNKVRSEVNEDHKMLSFNKKAVVQAVIYSEILGKPRSKSPHFARRRQS